MRTIGKYRGKRVFNSGDGWVHGYLMTPSMIRKFTDVERKEYVDIQVHPKTVGQFAELENRGGESFDWWEGDILHMNERFRDEFHASVIVKKDGCFMAHFYQDGKPYKAEDGYELHVHIDAWMKDSRVKVGNIHDNPNLLTDKQ